MIISIVNQAASITDEYLQEVIRAINRQITEDFEPYWSFGAQLRLEGRVAKSPDKNALPELRGDAVIYLWDQVDMDGALGYHEANARGIPYGFVFTELAKQLKEDWTVTLSHEALELLGDAQGNLLVQGPHPEDSTHEVFHWFEMCDAVQSQSYEIDGIKVSNFLLPLYFTTGEQEGGRNDFLGRVDDSGNGLKSFGASKGGYIGFYDPRKRAHETYSAPEDKVAARRVAIKNQSHYGRGYLRKRGEATLEREDVHNRVIRGAEGVRASATRVDDPIKHVVVLMMENSSFDHMLGGIRRIMPRAEGVDPKKPGINKTSDGRTARQAPGANWTIARDLNHELVGTLAQLGTAQAPMSGFAQSCLDRYPDATQAELDQVMAYYDFGATPAQDALPVLHGLAREFTVCDHWFSSLPGPTWPNRFFVHSGTSLGHVLMPSMKEPQNMRLYYQETIFDRLSDAGVKWKIFHDGIPQSIVLTRLLTRYLTFRGYSGMDDFFAAAQGSADEFPEYAFIEPRYFGADENDQHPPADVRRGEQLIADVYNALRANVDLWNSTLLVLLYDEHGGFYDHVSPPASVAPDAYTGEYTFNRLGVRVPALLISPWVERGVVSTVFDHSSLLRYLCEKWNLPPLGLRMQSAAGPLQANTFGPELTRRQTPRTDTPERLEAAAVPATRKAAVLVEPPIEGSREALLMFVDQLPEAGPATGTVETPPKGALRAAASAGKKRGKDQGNRGTEGKTDSAAMTTVLTQSTGEAKLQRLRLANRSTVSDATAHDAVLAQPARPGKPVRRSKQAKVVHNVVNPPSQRKSRTAAR